MQAIDREEFTALLQEVKIKPRLKRDLRFVPEDVLEWENRDFLAVMNKSRAEGVLLVPFSKMYIIPLQLQSRKPNKSGRTEAIICDICATWQRGSNSAVITFTKINSTVSFLCCGDLDCSLHVRNLTNAAQLSRTQLRENTSVERRVERLQERLKTILQEVE